MNHDCVACSDTGRIQHWGKSRLYPCPYCELGRLHLRVEVNPEELNKLQEELLKKIQN